MYFILLLVFCDCYMFLVIVFREKRFKMGKMIIDEGVRIVIGILVFGLFLY